MINSTNTAEKIKLTEYKDGANNGPIELFKNAIFLIELSGKKSIIITITLPTKNELKRIIIMESGDRLSPP